MNRLNRLSLSLASVGAFSICCATVFAGFGITPSTPTIHNPLPPIKAQSNSLSTHVPRPTMRKPRVSKPNGIPRIDSSPISRAADTVRHSAGNLPSKPTATQLRIPTGPARILPTISPTGRPTVLISPMKDVDVDLSLPELKDLAFRIPNIDLRHLGDVLPKKTVDPLKVDWTQPTRIDPRIVDWSRIPLKDALDVIDNGNLDWDKLDPRHTDWKKLDPNIDIDLTQFGPATVALLVDPSGTLSALLEVHRQQQIAEAEAKIAQQRSELAGIRADSNKQEESLLAEVKSAGAGVRKSPPADYPLHGFWKDIATLHKQEQALLAEIDRRCLDEQSKIRSNVQVQALHQLAEAEQQQLDAIDEQHREKSTELREQREEYVRKMEAQLKAKLDEVQSTLSSPGERKEATALWNALGEQRKMSVLQAFTDAEQQLVAQVASAKKQVRQTYEALRRDRTSQFNIAVAKTIDEMVRDVNRQFGKVRANIETQFNRARLAYISEATNCIKAAFAEYRQQLDGMDSQLANAEKELQKQDYRTWCEKALAPENLLLSTAAGTTLPSINFSVLAAPDLSDLAIPTVTIPAVQILPATSIESLRWTPLALPNIDLEKLLNGDK